MRQLPEKRNDWFEDHFFKDFLNYPFNKVGKNMQMMKTDISETNNSYVLDIDLPGFDKEDIKIHLGENYLTVYAQREESAENRDENSKYIYQERHTGSCSRSFYVGNIKEEYITASYNNGTLTITIPKENQQNQYEKKWIKVE